LYGDNVDNKSINYVFVEIYLELWLDIVWLLLYNIVSTIFWLNSSKNALMFVLFHKISYLVVFMILLSGCSI